MFRGAADFSAWFQEKERMEKPAWMLQGQYNPQAPGRGHVISNPRQTAADMRMHGTSNRNAASELRAMFVGGEVRFLSFCCEV